jgi:hypothetical protein
VLKKGDGRRVLLCLLELGGPGASTSKVLLLALSGWVCLPQPAAAVAVEVAFCPVHAEDDSAREREKKEER